MAKTVKVSTSESSAAVVSMATSANSANTSQSSTTSSSNGTFSNYETDAASYNKKLSDSIRGSTRLFGVPHQFLPHNDPRIGSNTGVGGLGKLYTEKIILEAPIVHFKPGKTKFMPGSKSSMKKGMLNALSSAISGDYSDLEAIINSDSESDDVIKYFGFEPDFSSYMSKVNLLCRFMAYFLGISDTRVPWAKHTNFGHYDWRYYNFKKTMDSKAIDMGANGNYVGHLISSVFESASKAIGEDTEFISFYVDSNASFSESFSNSTTQSMIKQYTDQISSVAKELETVSNISGLDVKGLASSVTSSMDSFVQNLPGDGALSGFMKRLTGTTNQIIQGANFLVPEIWSDSEYSKSYSIPITLSTPYGNKISWYINIGVPLCFILGLVLPQGSTANTYTSPCLVQTFSQGWFNSGMGIITDASLDKGGDGSWNAAKLPNEIKVSLTVKDLYQSLSLPKSDNPLGFMQNTGMLEFLLINSGVDLTVNGMFDVWKVWAFAFKDVLTSKVQAAPYDVLNSFRSKLNSLGKLLK